MTTEIEKPLSPLSPGWAERHADECDYVIVGPLDVVAHSKSEEEAVSDFIRNDKPYLALKVYRKITLDSLMGYPVDRPKEGHWVIIEGLNYVALRADYAPNVLKWFPIFNESREKKLYLYERIDISAKVQAVYDQREEEAAAKLSRERERKDAADGAAVLRAVRCGAESIAEIAEGSPLSFARIEKLVNRLMIQGVIESVDFQPPVIKVLRIKGS